MRTLNIKAFIIALLLSLGTLGANAQLTFTDLDLVQVGVEGLAGSVVVNPEEVGSYDLTGGGNDTWDVNDNLTFLQQPVLGDFDLRCRVQSIENTDHWVKAGINARESLDSPARYAFQRVSPVGPTRHDGDGANDNCFMYRTWIKDSAGPNGGQHEERIDSFSDAPWIRLQRVGTVFYGYASRDGINWGTPLSQNTTNWASDATIDNAPKAPMANTLNVGLSVSSHWAGETSLVEFRDFGSPDDPVQISRNPADTTVTCIGQIANAQLSVGVAGGYDFVDLQWYKGTELLPGETRPVLNLPNLTTADSGATFYVTVSNKVNETTASTEASPATLTVLADEEPPALVSAESRGAPNWVVLKFSEAIDPDQATSLNIYNFYIDNNLGVPDRTFMGVTPDSVVLYFSQGPIEGITYTVSVDGVLDVMGNALFGGTAQFVMLGDEAFPLRRVHIYKWNSINNLDTLRASAVYPDNPDEQYTNNYFEETTDDAQENFSARIFGIYNCDKTGDYRFFVCSDDRRILFLSTDDTMAKKVQIAREPSWNNPRDYMGTDRRNAAAPENRSALIRLEAGKRYYMEQVMDEGCCGDNASVAVQRPGGGIPSLPISENFFVPTRYVSGSFFEHFGEGRVAQGPAAQTVFEGLSASFNVYGDGTPPYMYQWYRDGAPIAGATQDTFTTPPTDSSWDGAQISVCVSNQLGGACSAQAALTVEFDITPPTLVSAEQSPDGSVLVHFSEPVSAPTGTTLANYSLEAGSTTVAPTGAVVLDDLKTVQLTFAEPLQPNTTYTLTVKDVQDRAQTPNTLTPNPSTATFKTFLISAPGYVVGEWWYNILGSGAVAMLTADPRYPNAPERVEFLTTFNIDQTSPGIEYYGARMIGYIVPAKSGSYNFSWYSDDSGYLLLSPNTDPSKAVKVVEDTGCCATRYSEPVNLTAGHAYWAFAIFKEGTGGDYAHVQWKLNDGVDAYHYINSAELFAGAKLDSVTQPTDQAVVENMPATFSFAASGDCIEGLTRQWFSNDVAIAGANDWKYTLPITPASADQAKYHIELLVNGQTALRSADATLSVSADNTVPQLVSIACNNTLDALTFIYSEAMTAEAAIDPASYGLSEVLTGSPVDFTADPGVLSPDGTRVTFMLAASTIFKMDTDYQVETYGLTDLAGHPLENSSSVQHSCIPAAGYVSYDVYSDDNTAGCATIECLYANARYLADNPNASGYIGTFNTRIFYPGDSVDHYVSRMRGFFTAPETGDFEFFTKSDDACEIWLGNDYNTMTRVTVQINCCNGNWADIRSGAIPLVAGKIYAIEVRLKEGGGGDYAQVAVKFPSFTGDVNALGIVPSYVLGWVEPPLPGVAINITEQPVDVTGCEQQTATFHAAATVSGTTLAPITTWQKSLDEGLTWIPLGQGATYTTPALALTDNGAKVRYIVSAGPNYAISATATITVLEAASVLGALPTFNLEEQSSLVQVGVLYSKPMSDDVINPGMYTIDQGIQVIGAAFDDETRVKVTLQVTTMAKDTSYLLTVDPTVTSETGAALCGASTATIKTPNGVAGIDFAQPLALQGGSLVGTSYTKDGILHMTDNINSQQGGFYWDPFGSALIRGFKLSFNLRIGEGTCCSGRFADGMSMSFATDHAAFGSFPSEEGTGSGVIVSFDTWDNNGADTAPALDIKSGSNADPPLASLSFDGIREGGRAFAGPLIIDPASGEPMTMWSYGEYVPFVMQLLPDGSMNVSYKGVDIFTAIQTQYVPVAGAKFLFAGRTGGANENAWIKDLVIEEIYTGGYIQFTKYALDPADPTQLDLEWTAMGVTDVAILGAPSLDGPWTEVQAGATSPAKVDITGGMQFFKLSGTAQ